MVTPDKIDEWIHEAEERPSSASLIIRFIGNRLIDLTKQNNELLNENISLRSEKKVDEYEERISTLEYQIGLLKRQIGGDSDLVEQHVLEISTKRSEEKNLNVLIYNPLGQVLRVSRTHSSIVFSEKFGSFMNGINPTNLPLRLASVPDHEELLFVYDSGRTVSMPVTNIAASDVDHLDWQQAYLQPPLGTEELAFISPVARMAMFDYCLQISRKGCVKKIKESLFETYVSKSYIGTGVKASPDKTCELVLSKNDDRLVLISKEGFLTCLEIESLPTTIEEVLRLNITDHIVKAFAVSTEINQETLLFVTQSGKVIQRNIDWLDIASSFKSRGQAVFSQERRDAGVRLISGGLAKDDDWGIVLRSDGKLAISSIGELINTGNILSHEPDISILGFTTYRSV